MAQSQARISEAAERYAAAMFDLAQEAGALDAVEKDFAILSQALEESADLRLAAGSPLIAPEEKAKALTAVAQKLGVSALGIKLIGVAAQNRRAGDLAAIAKAFMKRLTAHRGAREVEIIAAAPLEKKQLDDLILSLSKALGKQIEATVTIDERLIGGFVVRAGSRQFDASVRTKLDSLRLALKSV